MSQAPLHTDPIKIAAQGKRAWDRGNQPENCPYDDHRASIWINAFKNARRQTLKKKVEILGRR